jgi:transposase
VATICAILRKGNRVEMDILRNPRHWQLAQSKPGEQAVETFPGEYYVRAISLDKPGYCPYCRWIFFILIGTRIRLLSDRPIDDMRVTIEMRVQRYECTGCGRTFSQPVYGVADNANITDRFVRHVEEESLLHPYKVVERLTHLSHHEIRDIFANHAIRLLASYKPVVPRVLCMDGVYYGRVDRAMLLDGERGTVYDLLPRAKAWKLYRAILKKMTRAEREAVQVLVIDMSLSLRAVAERAFPNAVIVIDRFHVFNRVNKAMEKVRGALSGQRGRRKGLRQMIRKEIPLQHEHQLEKEKNAAALAELQWWRDLLPEFDEAYRMKEAFCEIWYSSCVETALERYETWKEYLEGCSPLVKMHFKKELVRTVDNWREEIFAYFDHRFDNGAVERMNQEVKRLQRESKRLLFDPMRVKMIFGTALRRRRAEQAEQHKAGRKSRRATAKKSRAATRKRNISNDAGGAASTGFHQRPESDGES